MADRQPPPIADLFARRQRLQDASCSAARSDLGPAIGFGGRIEAVSRPDDPTVDEILEAVDERTRRLLERRRAASRPWRRGWLLRRCLLAADLVALCVAFVAATLVYPGSGVSGHVGIHKEFALFFLTLPAWVVVAKVHGLYDHDDERADHSTVDDFVGVFHLVTIGAWLLVAVGFITKLARPELPKLIAFWMLAIALVPLARAVVRTVCRRHSAFLQNTIIVGAGDVGQLIARKLMKHPEYGLNVVGFVDSQPKVRRADLPEHFTIIGPPEKLRGIVEQLDVERVVISFSNDSAAETLELVRTLHDLDVQVDVVPRLFELVGPRVVTHSVEGLPLVGLPPTRLPPSSRMLKRTMDIVGASVALLVTAPLFAYVSWRIKRDSPGPVFFRQTRLGFKRCEFTALKFRTMRVDTDSSVHRDYIKRTMSSEATVNANGIYKLDRGDAITNVGRWLRRTSLDELPQLLNVLKGDMSLVGPRPCIPYETEHFKPHHFERFLMPQGLTGLWQVTARANSTFGEALDMDVAYVRGWSLGLDLRLLLRTPIQLLRQRASTA
jgi:exopolysaccharide biosynthesis polyprenyl glycosylphosphotransferase